MNELERKRLDKQKVWTAEQVLEAALADLRTDRASPEHPGAKCVAAMVMLVVQVDDNNMTPVVYNGGFKGIAEQVGYLELFRDKLLAWWYR